MSQMLGHASTAVTMDTYTHLTEDKKRQQEAGVQTKKYHKSVANHCNNTRQTDTREHTFVKKKYLTPIPACGSMHKVIDVEEKLRQTYLYDFYGELLNEHQRRVFEDYVCNDLSLSEIAAELGISRQGVADLVRRCERKLLGYEEKLHLVERFLHIRSEVAQIHALCRQESPPEHMEQIERISSQILEEL